MNEGEPQEISRLLIGWSQGDAAALNELMSLVYPELRKIARRNLGRQGSGHTLESAALANEAFLRLNRAGAIQCENRLQFFALCATVIRRIVGEYARSRRYQKRGGNAVHVLLDEVLIGARERGIEIVALDNALASLSQLDARKGRIVELRYFGGLSVEETAEVIGISTETVKRDWRVAKAWLYGELSGKKNRNRS